MAELTHLLALSVKVCGAVALDSWPSNPVWRKMEDSNPQEVSLMSVFWTAALPLGESSVSPGFRHRAAALPTRDSNPGHYSSGHLS